MSKACLFIKALKRFIANLFSSLLFGPLAISMIILLIGCQRSIPIAVSLSETAQGLSITSDSIHLQWIQPIINIDSGYLPIQSYSIFIRIHSEDTLKNIEQWKFLKSIPASQGTSTTIFRSELGDTSIDFAIMAIDAGDSASVMESSLSPSAIPHSGWYLLGKS